MESNPSRKVAWRRGPRGGRIWLVLLALAVGVAGIASASVVLLYHAQTRVTGTTSPLHFVNGANYASANVEGFTANSYSNAQQVSVGVAVSGANGAAATYALDTVEVQAQVASTFAWHLRIDVTTALAASGVNAADVFYCTSAPSGVPDTGAPLASGTDANGNPWAIFTPTCAGGTTSLSLTTLGTGTTVNFASLTAGQTLLYLSFAVAVTNTGATTTTPAGLTLTASSP